MRLRPSYALTLSTVLALTQGCQVVACELAHDALEQDCERDCEDDLTCQEHCYAEARQQRKACYQQSEQAAR